MIFRLDQTLTSARRKGSKKKRSNAKLVPATAEFRVEPCLMDLARLRVAQILGCKRCMREYAAMLKKGGETNQRLRLLESWRNELAFTPQEKAALNLAEAVTCNPLDSIPGQAIYPARLFFTEEQLLLFALEIVAINDRHYLGSFQHEDMTRRRPHE